MVCSSCGAKAGAHAKFCPVCGTPIFVRHVDDYVGATLAGKYRVEAMIGEGGMGRVFRATHLTLDKPVVLKVLRHNLLSDERTVARFQREAKAASRLNHPNSISVLDFGQAEDGALYIAMEFVGGQDLHFILAREWPLPESRVVRIVSQVLSALADAHGAGVIHRDLKPENIMVEPRRGGETDFVKVLDFGIAKILDLTADDGPALTRAGYVCGTPEYMSPEQARGMTLDQRSDLYAVGVILYQLTSGLLPFEASSAVGFATKHLNEVPRPPTVRRPDAKVSAAMERLILKALSKSPSDRPQTAEAFKAELLAVDRERAAERAQKLGTGVPVLAPLPAKLPPADGQAPAGLEPGQQHRKGPGAASARAGTWGSDEGTDADRTEAGAPPDGSSDRTPISSTPLHVEAAPTPSRRGRKLAAGLVALCLTGAGAAWVLGAGAAPSVVHPPGDIRDRSAAGSEPDGQRPLFMEELPEHQWRPDEAQKLAEEGDRLFRRGDIGQARSKYQEAFAAKPDPEFALKLGALYYADSTLDPKTRDFSAKGWWRRHLQDAPDSHAAKQLVALYPELEADRPPTLNDGEAP